jgi:hypothetical protein
MGQTSSLDDLEGVSLRPTSDGGDIVSEGGGVLLLAIDARLGLTRAAAAGAG